MTSSDPDVAARPVPISDARGKVPMLSWWGMIPTIIFIAIQAYFGWPVAKVRESEPAGQIGYFMGGLIGGPLIALGIGWMAFVFSRRSRFTATAVYSLILAIVSLGVLGSSQSLDVVQNSGGQRSGAGASTSFGSFRFDIPAGWTRVPPDRQNTVAMLVLTGKTARSINGMLKVDVGNPKLPTAREMAQSFAGNDGRILDNPVSVDGVEGFRVETPSSDMSRPRLVVVVYRDKKAYLIMAAAEKGADIAKGFDRVVESWRWNDSR